MKIKISALRQMIKEEMEERGRLYIDPEKLASYAIKRFLKFYPEASAEIILGSIWVNRIPVMKLDALKTHTAKAVHRKMEQAMFETEPADERAIGVEPPGISTGISISIGAGITDMTKKAEAAAEAALENLDIAKPRRGEDVTRFARFGAPIENEIHRYIKDNWPDIDSDEKFKIADKALSLAGRKLGVGPDAL